MKTPTKLGAYGLVLGLALAGGAAAGDAIGPVDVGEPEAHDTGTHTEEGTTMTTIDLPAGGLLVSQDGYTIEPESRELGDRLAFTITGPDGEAVTDFDVRHDRELHLVLASSDLRTYAHLHPERDADGRWAVELPELVPGAYRAFADFQATGGEPLTLGVDVTVPGELGPVDELQPVAEDEVGPFTVSLEVTEDTGEATVTVRRDGEVVVTDPYLGAAGHLVALRDGDLAYVHVHPLDEEPSGPVAFGVEVPSAGRYALFFDFSVDGTVRTARFVADLTPAEHGGGH